MRSLANLTFIDPTDVVKFWPIAREFIKDAIDKTGLSDFETVEAATLKGEFLLWLAWEGHIVHGAGLTQIVNIAGQKICVVVAWGGKDRALWLSRLEQVEARAKAEGCAKMRIFGRPGWERVLDGYGSKFVVLDKDI